MITSNRLAAAAPTAALVLSFIAVLVLGQLLGQWLGPSATTPATDSPPASMPATPQMQPEPDRNRDFDPSPVAAAQIEDLGGGRYSLGPVQRRSEYAQSEFSPIVIRNADHRQLKVCITMPTGRTLDDGASPGWGGTDRQYCRTVPAGTPVTFAVVNR
jgi:hypothetical protein